MAKGGYMKKENENKILSDDEIVDLYWARKERAIKETERKYSHFLFKIAYNILNDKSDCEECQNDTYVGIWNAIPPTRPAVFQAFIARIMRNIAINRYKEKMRKKTIPSEFTTSFEELYDSLCSTESVEEIVEAEEVGKIISEYVRGLSKNQQYIFVGRFYMADTIENIAKELGITTSSVYKAIYRIKKGLKSYLQGKGVYL